MSRLRYRSFIVVALAICGMPQLALCDGEVLQKLTDPLALAVARGDAKRVLELIKDGADPNAKDVLGNPIVVGAVVKNYADVVRILLSKGVSVNTTDLFGNPLLVLAAKAGNLETVRVLLEGGAEVNARGLTGKTSLDLAEQQGYKETVQFLREKGARTTPPVSILDSSLPERAHSQAVRDLSSPSARLVGHWSTISGDHLYYGKMESGDATGPYHLIQGNGRGPFKHSYRVVSEDRDGEEVIVELRFSSGESRREVYRISADGHLLKAKTQVGSLTLESESHYIDDREIP